MPRKPGTSGSEGGRRKRTRSPGTSSAAYPTARRVREAARGNGPAERPAPRPGSTSPAGQVGPGRGGGVPAALLELRLGARPGRAEVLRQRAVGSGRQGGGGTHRPAVGGAVCQAVAQSPPGTARRDLATARPGNPTGIVGLARAGKPVPALCARCVDGPAVPERPVRTLLR